jgi:glycosyltransferase involved in cell wall biosynthesis
VLLGRRLGVPVTMTLHGGELLCARNPRLIPQLRTAFSGATRIFAVCESLRQFAIELGASDERVEVIGNGVDADHFRPLDRGAARTALGLSPDVKVLVSMSQPSEEKAHHRVIEVLPLLAERWPGLVYLIAGADGMEAQVRAELEAQAARLGVSESVRFPDEQSPGGLPGLLSSADVFVHAARREGPANVLLEAMACGLPVVTTDAGSHRETVSRPELGELVPFGEPQSLEEAIDRSLSRPWDRAAIRRYAETHNWDGRIDRLCRIFTESVAERRL